MENKTTLRISELAEKEMAKIKKRCEISPEVEPKLFTALLNYYDVKKNNPEEATKLWGNVQHILDACPLKSC